MIQAWAPESFSRIPRGSHFYSSVERNALFFPSCSLASRSSAARSVHISPTQIKPGIVMAFCTGMLWKIRNLRTVVLTKKAQKKHKSSPFRGASHSGMKLLVSLNLQHRHNLRTAGGEGTDWSCWKAERTTPPAQAVCRWVWLPSPTAPLSFQGVWLLSQGDFMPGWLRKCAYQDPSLPSSLLIPLLHLRGPCSACWLHWHQCWLFWDVHCCFLSHLRCFW